MTTYANSVKCPECGLDTHELYHAISKSSQQKVLMCDACYDDSDEGLYDYDESWGDELNDTE